ncbi:MAG: dihydrofolate reductase, partial [Rhizobiales bacterium]|nr:dihydrofolate reductase [Hyphomicrobiales bacterium]
KPVIMGRKTWESLPKRPLAGRTNIVITRQRDYQAPGAQVAADVDGALDLARAGKPEEIAVIGGGEIFGAFLPLVDRVYLTEVDLSVEGDTFFPKLAPAHWLETSREVHEKGPNDTASFILRVLDRIVP